MPRPRRIYLVLVLPLLMAAKCVDKQEVEPNDTQLQAIDNNFTDVGSELDIGDSFTGHGKVGNDGNDNWAFLSPQQSVTIRFTVNPNTKYRARIVVVPIVLGATNIVRYNQVLVAGTDGAQVVATVQLVDYGLYFVDIVSEMTKEVDYTFSFQRQ